MVEIRRRPLRTIELITIVNLPFRTFRCLELALYHSLVKLPEPESAHEFF
jgi:transposase